MGHPRKAVVSMARFGTTRLHGIVASGRGRNGSVPSIVGGSLRPLSRSARGSRIRMHASRGTTETARRRTGTPSPTPSPRGSSALPFTGAEAPSVRSLRRTVSGLASDAKQSLRRTAAPAVRGGAALLLSVSLAACGDGAGLVVPTPPADRSSAATAPTVAPTALPSDTAEPSTSLVSEFASGLPSDSGTYAVVPGSIFRDRRGVYQFEWIEGDIGDGALDDETREANGHVARTSRLRLVRDDTNVVDIVPGNDPVLHLTNDEEIGLADIQTTAPAYPGSSYYPPAYAYWAPFYGRPSYWDYVRPWYYDPPRTVVIDRPVIVNRDAPPAPVRVSGGNASTAPAPLSQRTTEVTSKGGGRAGDTGAGFAVTARNQGTAPSDGPVSKGDARAAVPGATGSLGAAGAPPRVGDGNAIAPAPPRVGTGSSATGSAPPRVSGSSGSTSGTAGSAPSSSGLPGSSSSGSSPPRVSGSSGSASGSSGSSAALPSGSSGSSASSPPRVSGSSGSSSAGSSSSSGSSGFGSSGFGSSAPTSKGTGSSFGSSSSSSSGSSARAPSLPAPRSSGFSSGSGSSGGSSSS